jgi:flagellar motor switch protein FliN
MDIKGDARVHLLLDALVGGLSLIISGVLQTEVEPSRSAPRTRSRWYFEFRLGGSMHGRFVAGFAEREARTLAQKLEASDSKPADSLVVDTLLQVCRDAASSVCQQPVGAGVTIAVDSCSRPPKPPAFVHELKSPQRSWMSIACWNDPDAPAAQPTQWPADRSLGNLDVILDIELPLIVRFGEKDMTLQALTRLGPGSVIDLGRSPDEPVEVLINDRMVARGEVVAVGGNYGVRITEVLSTVERIRSLAG